MASLQKRKYKSGKTVWVIRYRENGKDKLKTIGETDKRTAERNYHKFCSQYMENGSDDEIRQDINLKDFNDQYLEFCRSVKEPSTLNREGRVLKLFVNFFGNIQIREITSSMIDKYIKHRLKQPSKKKNSTLSKSTINLELRHLKAIFNTALRWRYIKINPLKGIKMLKSFGTPRPKYLEVDEIKRLRVAFKGTEFQNIVDFYLWTGVRLCEALSLSFDDIDFKKCQITIKARNSKSKKYRYLGFEKGGNLGKMLRSLIKRQDNKVFGPFDEKGNELPQWKSDMVSRKISRTCSSISLEWASCHSLRFTYASHLVMAGVPLYVVKELLGHSSIKTTEIYAHLAEKYKTEMASKLPY